MPAGAVGSVWQALSWSATCWEALTWADAQALTFVLDLNTRLKVYLCSLYGLPATVDTTTVVQRYLRSQTGEMNARLRKLIADATAAMT